MPIVPSTLKSLIDTQITNETVDLAISPEEVGSRIKDSIDYTTEQIASREPVLNATNIADYYRGDKTFQTLNKQAVGLGNVDNLRSITKTLKTTISSAELLQLFTTPKVVLSNNDSNTIKIPISVYIFKNNGNNYTLNNNGFYFLNSTNNVDATLYLQCLTTSGTGYSQGNIPGGNHSGMSGITRMDSYSLQASGGNPTGGTATLDVYITYLEILL